MAKQKCLIIDDEPLAREVISDYIGRLDYLEEVGCCEDAITAIEFLRSNSVDLIFLDIQMPELDGIGFLKSINNPPLVIFTTAHREYAIDGFELNAIDYLLKPIPFYRFVQAVEKARSVDGKVTQPTSESGAVFFKVDKKKVKVQFEDILLVESLKDYVKVILKDRSFVTYQSINGILEILPASHFVRVHKSYVINFHQIQVVDGNHVEIGDYKIPIGRIYRDEAVSKIMGTGTKGWK